ncbi:MAG: ATP-binding cassette domain-containing protein [Clostridiales Family XIII bacterium]|jgi:molybdate transport system ATP-binding protein|nr:ATP-binding cassette domain-containing protein [Clostridiales Family XIII bacterium]
MSLRVDIKKRYKGFTLEVCFSSGDGTLALLGASGSGKSMTLKCIAGLISPDEGVITANGRMLFDSAAGIDLKPQRREVGYLFQNYALFPNMTIRQNIAVAYRGSAETRGAAVTALLARYELEEQADKYPVQLSGGQQQRAALARIFAYEPAVLLLDEPFSALDTFLRENMQAELKRIIRGYDGDVVLVTHSRDEAYKIADRLVILDDGRPVAEGTVQEVFAHPENARTARITGCKNISRIERTGERSFLALDWGIALEAAEPLSDAHTYAGIRAHDFSPLPRSAAEGKNTFAVEVVDVIEGPFEKDVIVRAIGPASVGNPNEIWWITDRSVKIDEQCAFTVRPEDILLLSE